MSDRRKRGKKIYWICLSVYTFLLVAAAAVGLYFVWIFAEEYEMSRPTNTMDAYVSQLSENLWGDSIAETISQMPHEMQTDEECAEIVKDMLANDITYVRQAGSSDDNGLTASYKLRCNGNDFGVITLIQDESKADELRFGMLPWIVQKEEFDFTGLYSTVEITVPAAFHVELNGHELGSEYIVEEGIHYDVLEGYYSAFPDLPTKVTYRFENVIGKLEPVVYDESGNEFTIDPEKDDAQFIQPVDDERRARFEDYALKFITRYKEYISGIYDPQYGYQRVLPYVKLGSDLDERLQMAMDGVSWAHTSYVNINSVVLNNAICLGEDVYMLDITADVTAGTARGDEQTVEKMKLIVTDTGDDIRAATMELYE